MVNTLKKDVLEIKNFLMANKGHVFFVVIACVLAYGHELSNWTMTVDEELYLNTDRFFLCKLAVGDGRWGIGLLKLLLPTHNCIPFFETFLTLGILIAAVLLFVYCFYRIKEDKWAQIGYSVIFITMPLHAFWIMFASISTELAVGFLFIGVSICFLDDVICKRQTKKLIVAVAALAFAIAVYQAFILLYIQLICSLLVLHSISEDENGEKWIDSWKFIGFSIACLIISVIIYFIVNSVTTTLIYKSSYVESYIRWGTEEWKVIISDIIKWLKIWYLTPSDLIRGSGMILFAHVLNLIVMVYCVVIMKKNKGIFLLAMVGNFMSIGLFICVFGGSMPVRAMLSIASYCAFSLYLLLRKIKWKMIRYLCGICTIIIVLNQAANVTKLFFNEGQRSEKDFMLATQLCGDVNKFLSDNDLQYDTPVAFVGTMQYDNSQFLREELFSWSYFTMGQDRLYKYLKSYSVVYTMPNAEQMEQAEIYSENMNVWPKEGAISLYDQIVVVKLGE